MRKIIIVCCLIFQISLLKCDNQPWINIFIHGSVGLRSNLSFETFRRLLRDQVEGSVYEKNILSIRENPYLFTMQPMQKLGLQPITSNCSYPSAPLAFANLFDSLLKKYRGHKNNLYYTFGWSGLVSFSQRLKAADILYNELKLELVKLNTKGIYPKIRIIGYSHGATIAFNLAAIRDQKYPADTFNIDEVIAIGMPVLKTTVPLIFHPIFKKIYHIYSRADAIQRLDIFSPCSFVSTRRFHGRLPTKLTQIELRVFGPLLRIPGKALPRWMQGTINQSPGHTELWFFGWGKRGYRRDWILWPLPTAIFIPYILKVISNLERYARHMIFELWPFHECAKIQVMQIGRTFIKNFMTFEELYNLKMQALEYHPKKAEFINNYLMMKCSFDPKAYL